MPKQIWQTFDGGTFDDGEAARSHEDVLLAQFVQDPGNIVSVRALWDASDIMGAYCDFAAPQSDQKRSERDVLKVILQRLLQQVQAVK